MLTKSHINLKYLRSEEFKIIAPDARLSVKEIVPLFNVCERTLYKEIELGNFPKYLPCRPSSSTYPVPNSFGNKNRYRWKKSTVVSFISTLV